MTTLLVLVSVLCFIVTYSLSVGYSADSVTTNDVECLGPIQPLTTTNVVETMNEIFKNIDSSCATFSSSPYNGVYETSSFEINHKPMYRNENKQTAFWTGMHIYMK